ncbi:MAG TPA: RIP metalloprotease RseP [Clostridia bacterium]|nr:RIP metalloprotease RseP [Clostridia bacterium]
MIATLIISATAAEVFTYIGYILIAILALMVMIVIHEFGHFLAGRLLGFKIDEFAIGFGPPIFKRKTKTGMQFSIRPFPVGGFCAFAGEDEDNPDPKAFNNQKPWKRLIVLFSGAFFNFVSAIIFISIFFMAYGQILPVITSVDNAGTNSSSFEVGDVILAINGRQVNILMPEDLNNAFAKAGDQAVFKVLRKGNTEKINISKHYYLPFEDGDLVLSIDGVELPENGRILASEWLVSEDAMSAPVGTTKTFVLNRGDSQMSTSITKSVVEGEEGWYFYGFGVTRSIVMQKLGFFRAVGRSFGFSFFTVFKILASLGALITGKLPLSSAGGTVTVVKTIAESTMVDFSNILYIIAIISANLAVMNLLPLPALDGSRMLFCVIEWIRKKPINRKVEGVIHFVGLVVLLVFAVFLDVFHLIS